MKIIFNNKMFFITIAYLEGDVREVIMYPITLLLDLLLLPIAFIISFEFKKED